MTKLFRRDSFRIDCEILHFGIKISKQRSKKCRIKIFLVVYFWCGAWLIWAVGSVDKWIVHDVQSCQPWMQRSLYNVAPSSSQKGLISAVCVILISLDLRAILSVGAKKGFTCGQSQTPISVNCSKPPTRSHGRARAYVQQQQQNQNPMAFSIRLPDSWSDLKHKKLSIRTISIQTASNGCRVARRTSSRRPSKFFFKPFSLAFEDLKGYL